MKDYISSINANDNYKILAENKSTTRNTIAESNFQTENKISFLKIIISKNKIPKIFGFEANKNQSSLLEEYKENIKIYIPKYKFDLKYVVFYQPKNCLDLFSQLKSKEENSNILDERFPEFIEALFYSYVNISFKPSFNSIKLIIIGKLNEENLYVNNFINNEKTQFVYKFHDILFILSLDYYNCDRNDGDRLVKIKFKIYFPEIYKYSSYFTSFIEKYISKYLMKKYDCNIIFIDIISKRQKLVFIYESKKKYNLNIFITIINHYINSNKSFNDKRKVKKLNNNKIIRVYDSGNQLFDNFLIKKNEEFQSGSFFKEYEELLNNNKIIDDSENKSFDNIEIEQNEEFQRSSFYKEYEEFFNEFFYNNSFY